jgi:PPOX class probable F420-dependent enzyme
MPQSATITSSVAEFLCRPLHAVLATHAASGSISQSVVWFELDAGTVWVSVAPGSVKARHVRRDPRVSLLVMAPHGGAYVRIDGSATADEEVTEGLRLRLVTRYQGADAAVWLREHPLPRPNTLLRIHPDKIVSVGV